MTERALELLNLPADRPSFLLDIGTGSGLSGEVLSDHGHTWVGVDISPSMLGTQCARQWFDLFIVRMCRLEPADVA